jgi:tetratricopeptide (TPR) repeat protein
MNQYERCSAYMQALTQRFTERRDENLRGLATVQRLLSEQYKEDGDEERAGRCEEIAMEALRESLNIKDSFDAHISLAEFLIDPEEQFDEAEEHLMQAKALTTDPADLAHIEMHLGEIAMGREQYKEALSHFQHVVDHDPDSVDSWLDIADAHNMLGNLEEADASYRRAIGLDPENEGLYYDLSKMYVENNQPSKAIEVMEEGISHNPDSAVLNIYLASTYMEMGDYRQAEIFLQRAERIDPDLEVVKMFRQVLNITRPASSNVPKLSRPKNKRKR